MHTPSAQSAPSGELHLLVRLGDQLVGLPARLVAEMTRLQSVHPFPNAALPVRGSMLVRDEIVAVKDLRSALGLPTLESELAALRAMLAQREQDHRHWIEELERSVVERRPFALATDPHACAFGRWYDGFSTKNVVLDVHLARFDAPHKRIHALASEVDGLVRSGRAQEAAERIRATRDGDLNEMIRLFSELDRLLVSGSEEIAVVLLGRRGSRVAYAVDRVESLQPLEPKTTPAGTGRMRGTCALYGANRELAVLLAEEDLLEPDLPVAS